MPKPTAAAPWKPWSRPMSGCGTSGIRKISFNAISLTDLQPSIKNFIIIDWLFRQVHDLVINAALLGLAPNPVYKPRTDIGGLSTS